MKRAKRIYTLSLYGALGGLMGSFLHQHLLLETLAGPLSPTMRRVYLALLGGVVGLAIGFFPSFSQGRGNYATGRAIRVGLIGAAFGGLGGAVALPSTEWLHIWLGGGIRGRAISLCLLGLAVGFAEMITGGARPWHGPFGGAIGGIMAGVFLELLLRYQFTYADSGIIALMIIGLFVALFIALFINILTEAWLEGQPGSKADKQIYHLGKFRDPLKAVLGSDKKGSVFIWIPNAQPHHAEITLLTGKARLRHIAEAGETRVNGIPVSERLLSDEDMIEIGHTRLKYRERRRDVLSSAPGRVYKIPRSPAGRYPSNRSKV